MAAKTVGQLPTGAGWSYEPKYDGYRALAFRDRSGVHLQSRQHAAESLLAFCNGLNRSAAKRSNMPLPVLWAARTALIDSGLEPGARIARRTSPAPAPSRTTTGSTSAT